MLVLVLVGALALIAVVGTALESGGQAAGELVGCLLSVALLVGVVLALVVFT
jgi:hypothetical protein